MMLHLVSAYAGLRASYGKDSRRLRQVAADPARCTTADVELLLRAHGVAEPTISEAMDTLGALDVAPPVAWSYAMAYDGTELAAALTTRPLDLELHHDLGGTPEVA